MKTPSDELFRLIKSLNGPEKRYLKLYASRHVIGGENKYMVLFDAIGRQDDYDEEAIKKQFRKHAFVKQLTVIKKYLYDLILKSLDAYHAENSVDGKLKGLLHYSDILYDKALYGQSSKVLDKAEKLAGEHEYFTVVLDVIERRLKIMKMASLHKPSEAELDNLYKRQQDLVEKISNYNTYEWLNNKIHFKILVNGWMARSKEEIEREYAPVMNHKAYSSDDKATSARAQIRYFHTHSVFHYLEGNMDASDRYSEKLLEVFRQYPAMVEAHPDDYISAVNNIIYNSIRTGDYLKAMRHVEMLKTLQPKSVNAKAKAGCSVCLPSMIVCNSTGRVEEAIKLIPGMERLLAEYGDYIARRDVLCLYYNCACCYFKAGDYKSTAHYLALILNSYDSMMLPDVQANARLLNLMVQYEMEEFEILPYTLRSAYRFLMKQQRMHKFEKNVLSFIRKLTEVPASGVLPLFAQLKKELSVLAKEDTYEKYAIEYFGFTDWLESKIQKKPITEVIGKNKGQAVY